MLLAFALTVPMALTLAPAINNRVALASSVRTGHVQAMDPTVAAFMNDADVSAVQIFSGALTLSLAGALFMRGDLSSPETTTAPSKGMEMKKYTVTVKRSMREKKLFEKKIAELRISLEKRMARAEAFAERKRAQQAEEEAQAAKALSENQQLPSLLQTTESAEESGTAREEAAELFAGLEKAPPSLEEGGAGLVGVDAAKLSACDVT